jgi:hypothetical protein
VTAGWGRLYEWTHSRRLASSARADSGCTRFPGSAASWTCCLRWLGKRVHLGAAAYKQRSGILMISGISSRTARDTGTGRFTKLGILVTIVIVLTVSAAQLINYGFFGQRIPALDPGSDGGVFGVIGDIAIAAAAISAWILAARARSARSVTAVLAGLLTFLTADNVMRLHDHIPHWLAFYVPVLAAAFICLVIIARGRSGSPWFRVHRGEDRAVVDRLIGAGLLLLIFSFLLHVFGKRLLLDLGLSDTTGLAYQTKAAVKHATEVAGWLLIAFGLLRLSFAPKAPS